MDAANGISVFHHMVVGSDLLTSHRLGAASAPLVLEGGDVPTADAQNSATSGGSREP